VGHFIREWRIYRGYTQVQLAEMIGVTAGAISQLETEKINYTQSMLETVAMSLKTDPRRLLQNSPHLIDEINEMLNSALEIQKIQIKNIIKIIIS
jgi:transcriptional regulator with XRE-family HTH domain